MAKRRELKKDINWVLSEVIEDCLLYLNSNKEADEQPVAEIINTVILKRNEIFKEINKPTSNQDKKEVKQKYKNLIFSFLETVNESYEKLSILPRK